MKASQAALIQKSSASAAAQVLTHAKETANVVPNQDRKVY